MNEPVKLWWHHPDPSRRGHAILPRGRAEALVRWATGEGRDDRYRFRIAPIPGETMGFLAAVMGFFVTVRLDWAAAESVWSFLRLYWGIILGALTLLVVAGGLVFAPAVDRYVLAAGFGLVAFLAFRLGMRVIQKS